MPNSTCARWLVLLLMLAWGGLVASHAIPQEEPPRGDWLDSLLNRVDEVTSGALSNADSADLRGSDHPVYRFLGMGKRKIARLVILVIVFLFFAIPALLLERFLKLIARRYPEDSSAAKLFRRLRRIWPIFIILTGVTVLLYIADASQYFSGRLIDAAKFLNTFLFFFALLWPLEVAVFDLYFESKKKVRVPRLLRDVIRWPIYLLALAYTFSAAFQIPLAPLFATSAVLSFILGFALQDTLANLFAGLAIHFEGSFSLGDWIKAADQEGEVAAITWRAIKIRTFEDDYMIIPNSNIARNEIINYSQPTSLTARIMPIGVSYEVPPGKVERVILEVLSKVEGVAQYPTPRVRLKEYGDFSINYNIRFWIKDYRQYKTICHEVFYLIWYHFKRENIEIPFPIRNVYMRETPDPQSEASVLARMHKLDQVGFLKDLSPEGRKLLARKVTETIFARGETVIRQGEQHERFFIIDEGTAAVRQEMDKGFPKKLAELSKGEFFGEHSLLTGEPASATVVAKTDLIVSCLGKPAFQELLESYPHLAESIGEYLARRKAERQAAQEQAPSQARETTSQAKAQPIQQEAQSISHRIRAFLGIR